AGTSQRYEPGSLPSRPGPATPTHNWAARRALSPPSLSLAVAGFPTGGLGVVRLVWGSLLGEVPVRAVSKRVADTGWITLDTTRPMRKIRMLPGRAGSEYFSLSHKRRASMGRSWCLGSWGVPQNFLFPQRDQPLLPVDMREW